MYKANASKQLARVLQLAVKYGASLVSMRGGSAHNAIPMDAEAVLCFEGVAKEKIAEFVTKAHELAENIKVEYKNTDPKMEFIAEPLCCKDCTACAHLSVAETKRFVDLLSIVPSYVLRMSQEVQGLVESSINVGTIRFSAENGGQIAVLARSSINSQIPAIND